MKLLSHFVLNAPEIDTEPKCFSLVKDLAQFNSASLTLMTILPPFDDLFGFLKSNTELQKNIEQQAHASLEILGTQLAEGGIDYQTVVSQGSQTRRLVAEVVKKSHDLLVKDAQPEKALPDSSFGAFDQKLVRHCPCPVWLVRRFHKEGIVCVAVDGELEDSYHRGINRRLLKFGAMLASFMGEKLHILHAWKFDSNGLLKGSLSEREYLAAKASAKQAMTNNLENFLKEFSIKKEDVHLHILPGVPSQALTEFCDKNNVNTLIMGTVGRAGLLGFLVGSTVERVMQRIKCSLLVVSPEQVQSPLELKLREDFFGTTVTV